MAEEECKTSTLSFGTGLGFSDDGMGGCCRGYEDLPYSSQVPSDAAKSELGDNDDGPCEEDAMVDDDTPVFPNSGTLVGDKASGTSNAAARKGFCTAL
mmetsp:Transcript_60254/g.126076  ORF Transcript_60254/g.126076 Transcript_60254/m.126076 type:complete len:98 (+) Transcript_60254:74-367(+)